MRLDCYGPWKDYRGEEPAVGAEHVENRPSRATDRPPAYPHGAVVRSVGCHEKRIGGGQLSTTHCRSHAFDPVQRNRNGVEAGVERGQAVLTLSTWNPINPDGPLIGSKGPTIRASFL
jgi:hypothetical protein